MNNCKKWLCVLSGILLAGVVYGKNLCLQTEKIIDLTHVASFEMNTDGEFFLFSRSNYQIFKFKADGTFEKSFCRKGEGPGEVRRAFFMFMNPLNHCLYIPEFGIGHGHIRVFDSQGSFKENSFNPDIALNDRGSIWQILFLEDGSYLLKLRKRGQWQPAGKFFLVQDEVSIKHFSAQGKFLAEVHQDKMNIEFSDKVNWGGPSILFSPNIIMAAGNLGTVIIALTNDHCLKVVSLKGKPLKTIELQINREKISDAEFQQAKADFSRYFERSGDSRMAFLCKNMIKLDYKPIFRDLILHGDQIILLKSISANEDDDSAHKTQMIFFDLSGKQLRQKTVEGYLMNHRGNTGLIVFYNSDGSNRYGVENDIFH